MRRFLLERVEDETNVSGTGFVAEGLQFTNGLCVLTWRQVGGRWLPLGAFSSVAVYPSLAMLDAVHGHGGKTKIRFIDETDPPHALDCPAIICQVGCNCGLGLENTP